MTLEEKQQFGALTDEECWDLLQEIFTEYGSPIPEYMMS